MADDLIALLDRLVQVGETKYNGEGADEYGGDITCDEIFAAMQFVAFSDDSETMIEKYKEKYDKIYVSLLNISVANWKKCSEEEKKNTLSKSRFALRFLTNLVNRCTDMASAIAVEYLEHFETLLATEDFDLEILEILIKTSEKSCIEFLKSVRYKDLLGRVIDAFDRHCQREDVNASRNVANSALAYIANLLNKDYAFLANCYVEMEPADFARILDMTFVLVENGESEINPNNLSFILLLLELIVVEYDAYCQALAKQDPTSVEKRKKCTLTTLNFLIECIAEMCKSLKNTDFLKNDQIATNCCVDVLDSILHAEAKLCEFRKNIGPEWPELPADLPEYSEIRKAIIEEKRMEEARIKKSDRPSQPPCSRVQRVEQSASLSALSDRFLEGYKTIPEESSQVSELKLNCLRAISNLSKLSVQNKTATTKNGRIGILSVLQCSRRRPLWFQESPVMQQWSLFCARILTDSCPENQEIILNLEQPDQPIINREKLLKEFGLKAVIDKNKRARLVKIDEVGSFEEDAEIEKENKVTNE